MLVSRVRRHDGAPMTRRTLTIAIDANRVTCDLGLARAATSADGATPLLLPRMVGELRLKASEAKFARQSMPCDRLAHSITNTLMSDAPCILEFGDVEEPRPVFFGVIVPAQRVQARARNVFRAA